MQWVVEHVWFEKGVIALIIANACFLMLDTPWTDADCITADCDTWSLVLYVANLFFVVVFTIEVVMKVIAYGAKNFCLGPRAHRCEFDTFPYGNWVCPPPPHEGKGKGKEREVERKG